MSSKRAKGLGFQAWVAEWLWERGWVVHNQPLKTTRVMTRKGLIYVAQAQDIFGCVDLIAKKAGQKTLWIQATMDSGVGRKFKDLGAVPWGGEDDVEVWVKTGPGKINILTANEWGWIEDYRVAWVTAGQIERRTYAPLSTAGRQSYGPIVQTRGKGGKGEKKKNG